MNILEYLRRNNVNISAPCGGNGTCGKCRVTVDGGAPLLACRTEYVPGMRITVPDQTDDMIVTFAESAESESGQSDVSAPAEHGIRDGCQELYEAGQSGVSAPAEIFPCQGRPRENGQESRGYGIAIDIGTTTIAGALCDRDRGSILASCGRINSNISFGADVISRIKACGEGSGGRMRENLLADIRAVVFRLLQEPVPEKTEGIAPKKAVDIIALSGNTTMLHTLMGYDLSPLGKYPYKPVDIGAVEGTAGEMLGIKSEETRDSRCFVFPGASAFVGGDIISGLYYLEGSGAEKPYALIDLGTNGEMAVVTGDTIYAASTAAGPVFEGGGISCGTGAVPGAIDHVFITEQGRIGYSTIGGDDRIRGICGSGIIDTVSVMLDNGLCDRHGTFKDERGLVIALYPDRSKVLFTQEDMRQVQLAKGAAEAGFEILCRTAGVDLEDIGTLYIAGGMGYAVDTAAAVNIGLVPAMLKERISAAGNTSLAGAIRFLCSREADPLKQISGITDRCRIVELSEHPDFQEVYMGSLDFRGS